MPANQIDEQTLFGWRRRLTAASTDACTSSGIPAPYDLAVADGDDGERGLQRRIEESRFGKVAISVFIGVFVLVGVVWNMPDSPIKRHLVPIVDPVAAPLGLNQYWGMYGTPVKRAETIEVHVKMSDGQTRVWAMEPGERGVGWWDRWIMLKRAVMTDASVRPQVAHWVVREITTGDERPVAVAVVLSTRNLSAPGEDNASSGKSATKVLYQETLVDLK